MQYSNKFLQARRARVKPRHRGRKAFIDTSPLVLFKPRRIYDHAEYKDIAYKIKPQKQRDNCAKASIHNVEIGKIFKIY